MVRDFEEKICVQFIAPTLNIWLKRNLCFLYQVTTDILKLRTYKLNITDLDLIRCKINDKCLLKKYDTEFLQRSFLEITNSPISLNLRQKLVTDLYSVRVDYEKSK